MTIGPIQKYAEALREVAMRKHVYPRWVANGKLKQEAADNQIAVMQAIADEYRVPAEEEKKRLDEIARANAAQKNLF